MDLEDRLRVIEEELQRLKILLKGLTDTLSDYALRFTTSQDLKTRLRVLKGVIEEREPIPPTEVPTQAGLPTGESATVSTRVVPRDLLPASPSPPKPINVEQVIGRPVLLTLGILSMLFAAGYFLTYAGANIILPLPFRLTLIIVVGLVLNWLGDRELRRTPDFGYALLGGGFGLLFISVYGTIVGFEQVPLVGVLAYLILIAGAASVLSLRHNSWVLAALGLLGGYLVPVILEGKFAFHAGEHISLSGYSVLAAYIILLTLLTFLLTVLRGWHWLPVISIIFAYLILGTFHREIDPLYRFGAVGTLFLILSLIPIIRSLRLNLTTSPAEFIVLVLNCIFFTLVGIVVLYDKEPVVQGSIGMGTALYFALLAALLPVKPERKRLTESLAGLAVAFTAISLIFLLQGSLETFGLTAAALVTLYLASRFQSVLLRIVGLLTMLWAIGKLALMDLWHQGWQDGFLADKPYPYLNTDFFISLAVVAGGFICLWLWHRTISGKVAPNESVLVRLGILFVNFALVLVLQNEARTVSRMEWGGFLPDLLRASSYLLHGGVLTILGIRRDSKLLRGSGLVLFLWTALWVLYRLVLHQANSFTRVVTLLILGCVLLIVSFWYYRKSLTTAR